MGEEQKEQGSSGDPIRSEEAWKESLSPEAFRVLRQNGTERPFSSQFHQVGESGIFYCQGCGTELFKSEAQFDSGCGWPSFDRAAQPENIVERLDRTHGMTRIEVRCKSCDGHLGHLFPDGPTDTGQRYCINGVCLQLNNDES
jgi:peptide-methionine (R)-S-oxide reductase